MTCEICDDKSLTLGEGAGIEVRLPKTPAVPGHLIVAPKLHAPIVEQVDDQTIGEMLRVANRLSQQMFEQLGAKGTNLLLRNGLAAGQSVNHASLEVLARSEGDGLAFTWQPKRISDEEMDSLQKLLTDELTKSPEAQAQDGPGPAPPTDKPSSKEERQDSGDKRIDYMIEQLRRIP